MVKRLFAILSLSLLVCIGAAQDFFHRPSPFAGTFVLSLATFPEVQKELKLTDTDNKKIEEMLGQAGQEIQGAFQDAGGDFAVLQVSIAKIEGKADAEYLKTLTPDQAKKLRELFVQYTGPSVIARDDFAKDLNLSDDQKAGIVKLQKDEGKKMGDLFQAGGDPNSMGPDLKKLRDQLNVDIGKLLKDDQTKKLEEMKGAKFEFQKSGSL